MRTRAIRSLTSIVACAVTLVTASSIGAVNHYTFAGKLTSNRGKSGNINVPMIGNATCGGLTFMSGPGVAGTMTPATHPNVVGVNQLGLKDLGCVPHAAGVMVATSGKGKGGAFTLPAKAFVQDLPDCINCIAGISAPGVLQFATSIAVTAPPSPRAFKTGAWASQTGRAAPKFTWCPPATNNGAGGPCTKIGQGGFPGIVKYNGTATSFGGTMSYVIHHGPNLGSLVQADGPLGIVAPFGTPGQAGMAFTQPTGRGYANPHVDVVLGADIHASHMEMTPVTQCMGPVTMLGPVVAMGVSGKAYNWGFPLTTRTVLVRKTGTVGGNPQNVTFTAKGYDCVSAKGAGCAVATGMGYRNISLVAGAIGVGVLPPPTGNVPTIALVSAWLPEPGATLQLLSGAIALLGIAVWRSRRVR